VSAAQTYLAGDTREILRGEDQPESGFVSRVERIRGEHVALPDTGHSRSVRGRRVFLPVVVVGCSSLAARGGHRVGPVASRLRNVVADPPYIPLWSTRPPLVGAERGSVRRTLRDPRRVRDPSRLCERLVRVVFEERENLVGVRSRCARRPIAHESNRSSDGISGVLFVSNVLAVWGRQGTSEWCARCRTASRGADPISVTPIPFKTAPRSRRAGALTRRPPRCRCRYRSRRSAPLRLPRRRGWPALTYTEAPVSVEK